LKPGKSSAPPLRLKRLWLFVGILLLSAVAIVSLVPVPATGINDKWAHLLTYAMLSGWFALLADSRRELMGYGVALIAYGALLEWLQGQTGYRYAELADFYANSLGVVCGGLVYASVIPGLFWRIDAALVRRLRA
jgi:VanZ family protein